MTLTQYRNARRALALVGRTRAEFSRDDWLAVVKDLARQQTTLTTSRPMPFERPGVEIFKDLESLKAYQAVEREAASRHSPGEIERAAALGDLHENRCENCDGARWVGVRMSAGATAVAVPCRECTTLEERAANAGIESRYRSATVESFRPEPGKERAVEFAREWDARRSVVFTGDVGRGKTHLGCGLVHKAIDRGLPARFVSIAELMDELKARFDDGAKEQSQAYFDRTIQTHVLMLDDLGKEQDTPWTRERVSTLIDRRYKSELPTIVTTNLTHKDIAERYGRHLGDRLYEWAWVPVEGVSMRREKAIA